MSHRPLTRGEIGDLPAVVDVVTAGRALGIGRTKAYELARAGEFPCRILRVGTSLRVPTADLQTLLGHPHPVDNHSEAQPSTRPEPEH